MEIAATPSEEYFLTSWRMEKGSGERSGAYMKSCEQRIGIWRMRRDMMEGKRRRGPRREKERMNGVKGEICYGGL